MTDRTLEPDAAFLARFADMDARPDAPESYAATVERMARAIWAADGFVGPSWEDDVEGNREDYRRLAAAAYRAEHEGGAA